MDELQWHYLEVMSLGETCLITDAGGNSEIVLNSKNGFATLK